MVQAEKERLAEQVKVLQAQLEDRDRHMRATHSTGGTATSGSRIARLGSGLLPHSSPYIPTPPPPAAIAADTEAQKKQFRDAMATKEHEIESLKQQLQRAAQPSSSDQEILDLQEENEYLRQEFDRLKTRYEAVLKNARKPTG
jgi:hypothetical protein